MPQSLPTLHIMPVGWDHPGWVGEFYPEDLPEDWRLGYYANEFPDVLLPQVSWIGGSVDQLQSWVDDVSDDFRFFLAISNPVDLSFCDRQAGVLGGNFGGLVFSQSTGGQGWLEAVSQPGRLKMYQAIEACISEPLTSFPRSMGMGLALSFNNEEYGDLVAQRAFFEQLQEKVQPDAQVLLCFAGAPPAIEPIKKLRQLARLMGLA